MRPLRRLRPRSVYDVLAAVALFILVAGGSAYAAATIGAAKIKDDAVRTHHIRDFEVENPDVAPNSIGALKVINGSLLPFDIKSGQLPQGARSLNMHVENDTGAGPEPQYGVNIQFNCLAPGHPTYRVGFVLFGLFDGSTQPDVEVIGKKILGETPSHARFKGQFFYVDSPSPEVAVDVMARVVPSRRWVRLQLTGTWSGNAQDGCEFGGLVTPPSG